MQHLGQVPQIGQSALPATVGQQPFRHSGLSGRGLQQGCYPSTGQDPAPPADPLGEVDHLALAGLGEVGEGPAEEAGERGLPDRRLPRLLQREQQRQPVPGHVGAEDRARAVHDRGDAVGDQAVPERLAACVGADQDADVGRLDLLRTAAAVDGGVAGQQRGDVGRKIISDLRPNVRHRRQVIGLWVVGQHSQPQRRQPAPVGLGIARRSQTAALVVGHHRPDHDLLVAEGGATDQRFQTVDQRLVAAPVDVQGTDLVGLPNRVEVAVDVGAAERVDGLLGVADQDHRSVSRKGPAHDLPLDRVSVLELVDHDHPVAVPQPGGCGLAVLRVGQRVPESGQHVVVGEQPAGALATVHFGADRGGEGHALGRVGDLVRIHYVRHQPGVHRLDRVAGDVERFGVAERALPTRRVPGQVEIGRHLAGQVGQVFDEGALRLPVPEHPQPIEHPQAELMRGGDGGRVIVRQGSGDPSLPQGQLGGRHVEQQGLHAVVRFGRSRVDGHRQRGLETDQPVAYPQPKLVGGHPAEGDEHQLAQLDVALGEIASGQSGDGMRLPRAGTGLQHDGAGGQRSTDVERRRLVGHHWCSSSALSSGWKTRRASVPNRRGSAGLSRTSSSTVNWRSSSSKQTLGPKNRS